MTTENYVNDSWEVAVIKEDMQLEMLFHVESIAYDYLKSVNVNIFFNVVKEEEVWWS